ncbi:MAG: flagellar hook-basal body complex protein FliE [Synergistaceae bacterium]|jgi:flagellar hook-basal body complex protein FliE|nr:flagellar hook-basal body complex protein FliE [Synergistaceae bacterium]
MEPLVLDMVHFSEVKQRNPQNVYAQSSAMSFEELLSSSMKQVNDLQVESDNMVRKLATGDVEDISEVVLASSRAEIALKMCMELRNKLLDAYQQLSRMSA